MVLIKILSTINEMALIVSVPLRGLWFLSTVEAPTVDAAATETFPSPCGDYGSYLP